MASTATMDRGEVTSAVVEEIQSPMTTDSMVTVPLSEHQSSHDPVHDASDLATIHTPTEEHASEKRSTFGSEGKLDDTPKNESISELDSSQQEGTEALPGDGSDTTDSESPGIGSPASNREVDWDKLDKTEEEEPRSEMTDEVCAPIDKLEST